jgi:hypothetical protein
MKKFLERESQEKHFACDRICLPSMRRFAQSLIFRFPQAGFRTVRATSGLVA